MKPSSNGASRTFITFHVTLALRAAAHQHEIWTELLPIPSFSVSCRLNGKLQSMPLVSEVTTQSTSCQTAAHFSFLWNTPAWAI